MKTILSLDDLIHFEVIDWENDQWREEARSPDNCLIKNVLNQDHAKGSTAREEVDVVCRLILTT